MSPFSICPSLEASPRKRFSDKAVLKLSKEVLFIATSLVYTRRLLNLPKIIGRKIGIAEQLVLRRRGVNWLNYCD